MLIALLGVLSVPSLSLASPALSAQVESEFGDLAALEVMQPDRTYSVEVS